MTLARSLLIVIALAGIASAATPKAFVAVKTNKPSCKIEIIAVDGHSLKSPQQQITISPGRHLISLRVKDMHGKVYETDGLDFTFKPDHHHSIIGWWTAEDKMTVRIGDDTAAANQQRKPATPAPTPDSRAMTEFVNSPYYQYSQKVHAMIEMVVLPEFAAHPERLKGCEVQYVFYLDAQGRIMSVKTHSACGSRWGEQTVARLIRGLKFGPVPPGVWKYLHQQGPPLKIDGGLGWKPR
jgi:hypothetical protein